MHELSLAYNICNTASAHVGPGQKLKTIIVECGPLSGVVPESLEFGFSIAAAESNLDGVKLELRLLKARATCPACGERFDIDSMWTTCIRCGHAPLTVEGGRELMIKEIQVEEENDV